LRARSSAARAASDPALAKGILVAALFAAFRMGAMLCEAASARKRNFVVIFHLCCKLGGLVSGACVER
jgi:hypothetical protein